MISSIDNLTGFGDAIESLFPHTQVQLCLVHQMRNSLRYVARGDQRAVSQSLQAIYKAVNLTAAESHLAEFAKQWGSKYPRAGNQP